MKILCEELTDACSYRTHALIHNTDSSHRPRPLVSAGIVVAGGFRSVPNVVDVPTIPVAALDVTIRNLNQN